MNIIAQSYGKTRGVAGRGNMEYPIAEGRKNGVFRRKTAQNQPREKGLYEFQYNLRKKLGFRKFYVRKCTEKSYSIFLRSVLY